MDAAAFREVSSAPAVVLAQLASRADRPRFHRRTAAGWEVVTWRDFAAQIAAVARFVAMSPVRPGDRVAIYAPNSVEWAAAALGIQAAGAVLVPIYPSSTTEHLRHVLEHSEAKAVFVDGTDRLAQIYALEEQAPHLGCIVTFGATDARIAREKSPGAPEPPDDKFGLIPEWHSEEPYRRWRVVGWHQFVAPRTDIDVLADLAARVAAIDLDQPALMLYTSGTSGLPKGVPLTHNMVGINARDWLVCSAPALPDDGVDLFWLPMSHIFGFGELCLGNTLGFESWMCTPAEVLPLLPEVRPSVFFSVPAYWEKLARAAATADLGQVTGGRLRFCLSGGAGLERRVKELFRDHGVIIIEGYGLTETSPTLTLNRPGDYRFDSVGKPLPSLELRLAEDGEILARGANVFRGYHKDPAATAAAFTEDGWFKTGDVGRFTDDGFLQIIDRKKDILVTSGGKNVPPANIEARFQGDPVIEQVVVYGDGKPYLVAGVWLAAGAPAGADAEPAVRARIDAVNAGLASFETIKRFRIMDRPLTVEGGLLTTSLKIRRKAIYAAFGAELEALYE